MNIEDVIKANNIFVDNINQLLHNEGVEFNSRLQIIINHLNHCLYETKIEYTLINESTSNNILQLIHSVSINKHELFQILFMFYCNKKTKLDLDQYYTPFTIGEFICNLMKPGGSVIDPACGTGDLVKNYKGQITLWDISPDVLDICDQNYKMNEKQYSISCLNSLEQHDKDNGLYDYCCLNPPFGSSTLVKNSEILSHYTLGKNKVKEEIGILFIERAMQLVKDDGIVFIIVPNGYLGNSTKNIKELKAYLMSYRIIAILELPGNTFSRSGTGVSTSLLIVQKTRCSSNYDIFIEKIVNIGYVLNKKNTPYKYKRIQGVYVTENNKPILDNDFDNCYRRFCKFAHKQSIEQCVHYDDHSVEYETVNTSSIKDCMLDINRYLSIYKQVMMKHVEQKSKSIKEYIQKVNEKFVKLNDNEYLYLDIKQITTPIYNKTNMLYGYELPSRAKLAVKKHDIILSKLKGKITFTMILSEEPNIVASNGFCLLRPKDYHSGLIIFANLFSSDFHIQHNSLCTGSIMETISESDIEKICIYENIDTQKYENIINALVVINQL